MASKKTLRPYQKEAVEECIAAVKKSRDPILLMASVGAGKSLMMAEILKHVASRGGKSLCLVHNAELVRNNAQAYTDQGGKASIYCAALNKKDISGDAVFATSQSVASAFNHDRKITAVKFDFIMVDEAHMINQTNPSTTFMRILNHFGVTNRKLRVIGATGTNFRFKGEPIVGPDCLFKKQLGNISTSWLIENGYLVKPRFKVDPRYLINFSHIKVNSKGRFDSGKLEKAVRDNETKTARIMENLVSIVEGEGRFGAFIFASTRKHVEHCMNHLPKDKSAFITGATSQTQRHEILSKARAGEIKYLVNINVLTVGVDVAPFDTVCYVRPTESLVLMVQTMGRGLRLAPGKRDALILDCAGNIERHQDWDDPIIEEALQQVKLEKPSEYIIPCVKCDTMNTDTARRCIGVVGGRRCDHYFEFKECQHCQARNDIASRLCRICHKEILDPNEKLDFKPFANLKSFSVKSLHFRHYIQARSQTPVYAFEFHLNEGRICRETFFLKSEKARNYFYHSFLKKHTDQASMAYKRLDNYDFMVKFLTNNTACPHSVIIDVDKNKIIRKEFNE